MILYQVDSEVYGCSTDNRTLVDLKKDGTYSYSDPTGMAEAGIAAFSGFSREGYTVDKKASATGTYEGWDSFAVEGQPATEKEYMDMVAKKLLMQCFDAMRLSKRGYDSPRLAAGSFICSMEC